MSVRQLVGFSCTEQPGKERLIIYKTRSRLGDEYRYNKRQAESGSIRKGPEPSLDISIIKRIKLLTGTVPVNDLQTWYYHVCMILCITQTWYLISRKFLTLKKGSARCAHFRTLLIHTCLKQCVILKIVFSLDCMTQTWYFDFIRKNQFSSLHIV